MCQKSSLLGRIEALALGAVIWMSPAALPAAEATVTKVNWSERWITNVIEVTMPTNRFVDEYRTNFVTQVRTNTVEVFSTNWTMETVTRPVTVEAVWTNTVVAYRTNTIGRIITNIVTVTALQTNVFTRYRTNISQLNLTNWVTVLSFRTNWVTQPVTNVVAVDLPANPPDSAAKSVEPVKQPAAPAAPAMAKDQQSDLLAITATRTTRPPANGLIEVCMNVRYAGNGPLTPRVQSWRIEREDGAVFLFGQEQEFRRQLPPGKYSVEARLRAEPEGQLFIARGTLSVTATEAIIQQRLLARK